MENRMKKYLIVSAALILLSCVESMADTRLIRSLDVNDVGENNYNASHWIAQGNLRAGVSMYGDEEALITSLSPKLCGADWIQAAFMSKRFRGSSLAVFTLKCAAKVYIAHSDALAAKPSWLEDYERTSYTMSNDKGDRFTFYVRSFRAGDTVTLGENGDPDRPMYLAAVVPEGRWPAKERPSGFVVDAVNAGAVDDGRTVNTTALQAAIDRCSVHRGGGTVYVDGDIFVTGTLVMKSGVTLWVSEGTILRASTDHGDFPPCAVDLPSYRRNEPLQMIFAHKVHDIGIRGGGVIDGMAVNRGWPWHLGEEAARPRGIRMFECRNIDIRDITLIRAACWMQYYEGCENLSITHQTVRNYTGVDNQDGLDISGCRNVRVYDYNVVAGDDAVCMKALSLKPMENVLIEHVRCAFSECNLVKIGTETHGDISNIHVKDVVGASRYTLAIESTDGSNIDGVTYEDIRMLDCSAPCVVWLGSRGRTFEGGPNPAKAGSIKNITFRNISNSAVRFVADKMGPGVGGPVTGMPGNRLENVTFENCDYLMYGSIEDQDFVTRDVPEQPKAYPEFHRLGICPAYGLYFRHIDGLHLKNVTFRTLYKDVRPGIVLEDVVNFTQENVFCESFSRTLHPGVWVKE